jgi:lipopolysaccharide transport system ATP-binding protein
MSERLGAARVPTSPAPTSRPIVLATRGLGKLFQRGDVEARRAALRSTFRAVIGLSATHPEHPTRHWALRDVSFEVAAGEAVGVLGRNGAGKSTLLRVIQGRLQPTEGRVAVPPGTSRLVDFVGALDPGLTGRENAALWTGLAGSGRSATDQDAVNRILAFADLADAADVPVRTYSSGMRARLNFALATDEPGAVLLVDEALSVGDTAFQLKCFRRMREILDRGTAIVLVTHDPSVVNFFCDRVLVLDAGRLVFLGDCHQGVRHYLDMIGEPQAQAAPPDSSRARVRVPTLAQPVVFESIDIEPLSGARLVTGQAARFRAHYRAASGVKSAAWGVQIRVPDIDRPVAAFDIGAEGDPFTICEGSGTVSALVDPLPLLPGRFMIRAALVDMDRRVVLDVLGTDDVVAFEVHPDGRIGLAANDAALAQAVVRLDVMAGPRDEVADGGVPLGKRSILRSPALERTLRADGYAVTGLLDAGQIAAVQEAVARAATAFDPSDVHLSTPFRLSAFHNSAAYKQRLFDEIWDIVASAVACVVPDYEPLVVNVFEKAGGQSDTSVAIHQNPTFAEDGERSVSIWVPLVDVDRDNGTVGVLPGSHLAFDYVCAANMPDVFAPCARRLTEEWFEPLELRAGECAILDDALVHWSWPNRSRSPRTAVQLIMVPRGVPHVYPYYDTSGPSPAIGRYAVTRDFFFRFNCKAQPEGLPFLGWLPFVYEDVSEAELVRRMARHGRRIA